MKHELVLIGSGNLASSLGIKLHHSGINILQVYSRNPEHAQALSSKLHCSSTSKLSEIHADATLYLVCIKDDAIPAFTKNLAAYIPHDRPVAHSSGVNAPEIIDPAFSHRGLFYPLQSFSSNKVTDWTHIPIFIEGHDFMRSLLHDLAQHINREIYIMNDTIRTHLHLASVFANNFSNYNLVIAKKILDKADVPFKVLKSLMQETVEKAFYMEPHDAQTGPAKRGDFQTIEKHIRLLVQEYPEYRSLYKKYSQIIQQDFKHENPGTDTTS